MRKLPHALFVGCLFLCGLSFMDVPAAANDSGALLSVTMQTRVGVLLDEVPGALRDHSSQILVAQPAAFWTIRARMQLEYTLYRLYSRHYFYEGQNKYQLPLPPAGQRTIRMSGSPIRAIIDGHDLVVADYTFTSVLLSDMESPAKAEPSLGVPGGNGMSRLFSPAPTEYI